MPTSSDSPIAATIAAIANSAGLQPEALEVDRQRGEHDDDRGGERAALDTGHLRVPKSPDGRTSSTSSITA